ncbi:MAG TPA: EAL domain-containing protein [Usitatibacter sp.]|nr:EAL domain-containing protein [Usitatibacter sp.]
MLDDTGPIPSPAYGAQESGNFRSWSREAEGLVRSAQAGPVWWEELRLSTHFQPIYCVRRARCVAYEALARAQDDTDRSLGAGEIFEGTPERRRVLLDWTLRALHLRSFARFDPGDRTLHLNVHAAASLTDLPDARELANLIRYYGVAPGRVCIELLDGRGTDMTTLREATMAYRSLGASVALTDIVEADGGVDRAVGLRPPLVKIDASRLAPPARGGTDSLSEAIRRLNRVGTRVAIEGIENAAIARLAVLAGADYLQGYHFGLPSAGLPDELEGQRRLLDALGRDRPLAIA